MGSLSGWHWLIFLAVELAWLIPLWKLLSRTGRSPWLILLGIVPLFGLVLLWWIAFSRWPAFDDDGHS